MTPKNTPDLKLYPLKVLLAPCQFMWGVITLGPPDFIIIFFKCRLQSGQHAAGHVAIKIHQLLCAKPPTLLGLTAFKRTVMVID